MTSFDYRPSANNRPNLRSKPMTFRIFNFPLRVLGVVVGLGVSGVGWGQVTAVDDTGATDANTVLTVANDAPGTVSGLITNNADLLLNDSGPDGATLTIEAVGTSIAALDSGNVGTATSVGTGGDFTIRADGSYTFNPDGDFGHIAVGNSTGTAIFYRVTDGTNTDTAELRITVTGAAPPDTAPSFGSVTGRNYTYLQGTVIVNERLPLASGGNGALTYTLNPPSPFGLVFTHTSATLVTLSGAPSSAGGPTMVTLTVHDADSNMAASDADTVVFSITVTAADDSTPSFGTRMQPDLSFVAGVPITNPVTLPMADGGNNAGGSPTYSLEPDVATAVPGLVFDATPTVRTLSGTPTPTSGPVAFSYFATDDDGDRASLTFTVVVTGTGVPDPDTTPTFGTTTQPPLTFEQSSLITAVVLPAATDGNGDLAYALDVSAVPGLTFTVATRTLSGTPDTAAAAVSLTYTVSDDDDDTASLTFTVTVTVPDTAPTFATTQPALSFGQGSAITAVVLPEAIGGNGELSYTLDVSAVSGLTFTPDSRTLSGTPDTIATAVTLTYTASDSDDNTDTTDTAALTFTVTVTAPTAPVAVDDTGATDPDTELDIAAPGVLSNDSDPNDDTLTVTAVGTTTSDLQAGFVSTTLFPPIFNGVGGGDFTFRPNGAWTFDPAGDFDDLAAGTSATASVVYQISDGNGNTATATLTVTVTAPGATPNQAPVAVADTGSTDADTVRNVADGATGTTNADLLLNDSDPDSGDTISVTRFGRTALNLVNAGSTTDGNNGGRFTVNANGAWRFDPNGNFDDLADGETRETRISYLISDGSRSASSTLTVTVTGTAAPDTAPTFATTQDDLSFTATTPIANVTLPVASGGNGDLSYRLADLATLVPGLTFTTGTRTLSGTPSTEATAVTLTYTAADADDNTAAGDTASLTFTVTVTAPPDTAPTFGVLTQDDLTFPVDQAITDVVLPVASGGNGDLSYRLADLATLVPGLNFDADSRTLSGTPSAAAGAVTLTYTAADADDNTAATDTASLTFTVTVTAAANRAPTVVADTGATDADTTITVADGATGTNADLLNNDSDLDGDSLTIAQVGSSPGSLVNVGGALLNIDGSNGGEFTVSANGAWTFDPDDDFDDLNAGTTETTIIYFTVSDGTDTTASQLTVTVTGTADDAPSFGSATQDDLTFIATAPIANVTLPVASGGNGALSYALDVSAVPGLAFAPGTRRLSGTPSAATTAAVTLTYTAGDADTNTAPSDTAALTFTVTVNAPDPTNNAPTAVLDTGTTDENTVLTVNAAAGLLANDSDPDSGDTLTITAVGLVAATASADNVGRAFEGSNGGSFTIMSDGSYTFDPDGNFERFVAGGSDSTAVDYVVSDGQGGTASATLLITVTGVNDIPVGVDDFGRVTEGEFLRVSNGDVGTMRMVTVDGVTTTVTENADVLLNDIDPDTGALTVSQVQGFTAAGGPENVMPGAQTRGRNGGQITVRVDGSYTFLAETADFGDLGEGEIRTTDVTYIVSDGTASHNAVLTITVVGTNEIPTVVADLGATAADTALTVADGATGTTNADGDTINADLLLNDSDPNGDALRITEAGPTHAARTAANVGRAFDATGGGSFTLNADGSWEFDPDGDFDDLTVGNSRETLAVYQVSDIHGADVLTTVTVTVSGPNTAPEAVDDLGETTETMTLSVADGAPGSMNADGDTINADLLLNDTDADMQTLTITEVGIGDDPLSSENLGTATLGDNGGHFTIRADGSWIFQPGATFANLDADETRSSTINYTVSDNNGGTATGAVTVTVTGENTPPVATSDQGRVDSDETLTVAANAVATTVEGDDVSGGLLLNDSDGDGDDFRILEVTDYSSGAGVVVTVPDGGAVTVDGHAGGEFVIHSNGAWSFDPDGDFDSISTTSPTISQTIYRLTDDGTRTGNAAFLVMSVYRPNDAPVAVDDVGTATEGVLRIVGDDAAGTVVGGITQNADLLLNDTDANSDSLSISGVNGYLVNEDGSGYTASTEATAPGALVYGSHGGQFTINANGSWVFNASSPDSAFVDLGAGDTRTTSTGYTVSDGRHTDIGTVTVTVTGANDAPSTEDDVGVTTENAVLTVADDATGTTNDAGNTINADILLNDVDPEGGLLTVSRIYDFAATTFEAVPAGGMLTKPGGSGGTFTIHSNGAWNFDPGDDFDGLNETETAQSSISYYAVDAQGLESVGGRFLTVTVQGEDDVPMLSADTATLTEDMAVDANGDLVATGTLTISGGDDDEDMFMPAALTGTYGGELSFSATGAWSYKIANSLMEVQQLAPGQSLVETLTVTSSSATGNPDGAVTTTVTITINGADDVPTLSMGTATVTEDSADADGNLVATGTVTTTGGDQGEDMFMSAALTGPHGGELSFSASGAWSYALDNSLAAIQGLSATDTPLTETFTLTSSDTVTTTTVTITIQGINDPPTLTAATGEVTEDSADASGNLVATGSVMVIAGDTGDTDLTAETLPGTYGSLVVLADRSWTYTAANNQAEIQGLGAGDSETEEFTVTSSDTMTTGTVTITIHGVDDVPTFTGTRTAAVTENMPADANNNGLDGAGNLRTQAFTITFADGDDGDHGFDADELTAVGDAVGTLTFGGLMTGATDTEEWYYTVMDDNAVIEALGVGMTQAMTFTTLLNDGVTPVAFTVTVTGADSTPTLSASTGSVTEDDDDAADPDADDGNLVATGTVTVMGGDAADQTFMPAALTSAYGELTFRADGTWTYTADNDQTAIQELHQPGVTLRAGQSSELEDEFTVTNIDGVTTTTVTITIIGADDTPTITATQTTVTVTEDVDVEAGSNDLVVIVPITVSGGDAGEDELFGIGGGQDLVGRFTVGGGVGSWVWRYRLLNTRADIQGLGAGQRFQESGRNISGSDGARLFVNAVVIGSADITADISATAVTVDEGESAIYTVTLDTDTDGAIVTITPTSDNPDTATVTPASLVFTSGDWNVARTVTVGGVEDDDAVDEPVVISHAVVLANRQTGDSVTGVVDVPVTVINNEMRGLMIADVSLTAVASAPSTYSVREGESGIYSAQLTSQPVGGDVMVSLASSDTAVATVSPASLVFTGTTWNVAQTVTVTGVRDFDASPSGDTVSISHSINGGGSDYMAGDHTAADDLTIRVMEIDMRGLVKSNVSLNDAALSDSGEVSEGSVGEGSSGIYSVQLMSQPVPEDGNVTVSLASNDTSVATVSPASVMFSHMNWDEAVNITVTGVQDDDANPTGDTVIISHSISSGGSDYMMGDAATDDVSIRVIEDDMVGLRVSAVALTVEEEETAAYTVELAAQPVGSRNGAVTVTARFDTVEYGEALVLSLGEVACATAGCTLDFNRGNWNVPQTITASALRDTNSTSEDVTITHTARGADYAAAEQVTVVISLDDTSSEALETLNEAVLPEVTYVISGVQMGAIAGRVDAVSSAAFGGGGGLSLADGGAGNGLRFNLGGESSLAAMAATHAKSLADDDDMNMKKLLNGSAFSMPLGAAGDSSQAGGVGLWGGGDYRRIGGKKTGGSDWNGDLFSFHLGADKRVLDDMLLGVMVSWSEADIDYEVTLADGDTQKGEYEMDLTSVLPYMSWTSFDGALDLWVALGGGKGDVEVTPQDDDGNKEATSKGEISTTTVGVGGSGKVLSSGAHSLRLKAEAFVTETQFKGVAGDERAATLADLEVSVNRVRLSLEAETKYATRNGGIATPSLEIGARYDGGDGENTGTGMEVGTGLVYSHGARGLTLETHARGLFTHSGGAEDWGVGGSIRIEPRGAGGEAQGLSLTLAPAYGNTKSQVDKIWADGNGGGSSSVGTPTTTTNKPLTPRLNARIAYATHATGWQITPYSEMSMSKDVRNYRVGMQWERGGRYDLNLFADREEKAGTNHGVWLEGAVRF